MAYLEYNFNYMYIIIIYLYLKNVNSVSKFVTFLWRSNCAQILGHYLYGILFEYAV